MTAASLRKRIGLPPETHHSRLKAAARKPEPVLGKEEVEGLPEDIFTKPVNLMEGKF